MLLLLTAVRCLSLARSIVNGIEVGSCPSNRFSRGLPYSLELYRPPDDDEGTIDTMSIDWLGSGACPAGSCLGILQHFLGYHAVCYGYGSLLQSLNGLFRVAEELGFLR